MLRLFTAIILLVLSISAFASNLVQDRPDIQHFISQMVSQYKINRQALTAAFNTIKVEPESDLNKPHSVLHHLHHQKGELPWWQYRFFFLNKIRINDGVLYWHKNAKWLSKANKVYGVPQSLIVATIGVESKYGRQMGAFHVFQSLAILTFSNQHRNDYFKRQLVAFLLYCKKNHIKLLSVRGSYAGAIGEPQFMPSNIAAYGVDFDHNGKVDIVHDDADAIASVANFYHQNHWHRGEPTAIPAIVNMKKAKSLLDRPGRPRMSLSEFAKHGITPKSKAPKDDRVTLYTMRGKRGPEYWLVFHNFYVIKIYNHATNYALALFQLSQAIREKYEGKYHGKLTNTHRR